MLEITRTVYTRLSKFPEISKFILVGGTALSLQVNHRLSEDLDFASLDEKLDRPAIKNIVFSLKKEGYEILETTPISAIEEFANEGLDLDDFHQDYLINGVKVTFFKFGDNREEREAVAQSGLSHHGSIRVLDADGLFITKCLALAERIKSRDIFDLWWFVNSGGRNVEDIFRTIRKFRPHIDYDHIRYRLLDWPIAKTDEGFESLVSGTQTIESIRSNLRDLVGKLEEDQAKSIRRDSFRPK